MRWIGDLHGKRHGYLRAIEGVEESVQVGDFGIGFGQHPEDDGPRIELPPIDPKHRFVRGNHDDPEKCKAHPNWIEDGALEQRGRHTIMYVGGARSIDRLSRKDDWWEGEQLSNDDLELMFQLYTLARPTIMVTHDCPPLVEEAMFPLNASIALSHTQRAFAAMFDIHHPEYWIFGHYHRSARVTVLGCRCICLAELETFDMDI